MVRAWLPILHAWSNSPPARVELGEAYVDDPVGLLVHLCRLLVLAAGESSVPVDELRERFLAWSATVRG